MVRRRGIHERLVSVFVVMQCSAAHYQNRLKGKGLNVSKSGVSVKTDKRFNREEYLDATQRSAGKLSAPIFHDLTCASARF